MALTTYRTDDLILATETPDFHTLGTCVGTISTAQLDNSPELKGDTDCNDELREDFVARALAVSVHGLYWVWKHNKAADTTFEIPGAQTALYSEDGFYRYGMVLRSVIASTAMAGCRSCAGMTEGVDENSYGSRFDETGTGGAKAATYADSKLASNALYPKVNRTAAYDALKIVAGQDVPTSCDVIYGMTGADADGGAFAGKTYDMTTAPPTESGGTDNDDRAYAREYYRKLMENDKSNGDWPIAPIRGACGDDDVYAGVPAGLLPSETDAGPDRDHAEWYGSQPPESMDLDAKTKLVLYAHCRAQFQYASSGLSIPYKGSFGIPLPGEHPGPNKDFFYDTVDGYDVNNLGGNYTLRARLYQGMRFGYSTWAYVPMILASTFLCADAIVFFLAEAALPYVIMDDRSYTTNRLIQARNSLVMAATRRSSRIKRLVFGVILVFVSLVFWGLFCFLPFNSLYESRMPRPFCEYATADLGDNAAGTAAGSAWVGADQDHWTHWVGDLGFRGSKGGWKSDWDASYYEFSTVIAQVVILILLPLTTTGIFNVCNRVKTNGVTKNKPIDQGQIMTNAATVTNAARYRFHMQVYVPLLALFAFFMILGQSISGARFGMAWAQGIVGQEKNDDGSAKYNPVLLAEQVYNQTIATIMLCIALGLLVGTAMQRHLIGGVGCFGAFFFLAWLVLVVVCALPLIIIASVRSLFNPDEANDDCNTHFGGGKDDFAVTACEARNWTFVIAGAGILIIVVIITVTGFLEALQQLTRSRVREDVVRPGGAISNEHPLFDQRAANLRSGYDKVSMDDQHVLGGYRSHDELFYNYDSKTDGQAAAQRLLYAPRVHWDFSSTGATAAP